MLPSILVHLVEFTEDVPILGARGRDLAANHEEAKGAEHPGH